MAKFILKMGRQPNSGLGAEQKVKSCTSITPWTLKVSVHLKVFGDDGCLLTTLVMTGGWRLGGEWSKVHMDRFELLPITENRMLGICLGFWISANAYTIFR